MNNNILDFFIHFIIGGTLIASLNYYSKKSKIKLIALIPAMPIIGIYGLYLTIKDKNSPNEYLLNISNFISVTLLFYILIFLINKLIRRIFISLIISLIIWLVIVYNYF